MLKLYDQNDYIRLSGANGVDNGRERGWTPFKKDYARLLHAPSFRRLQGKTQLYPGNESDFFRNRLTHSLEVAQIACGIALALNEKYKDDLQGEAVDLDLVQFAAIAHDLGHPPFGHNGEKALDDLMKQCGGFEGNAQTLRILTSVERKLVRTENGNCDTFGLDLTYRALAAVLKYDTPIALERDQSKGISKGYYQCEANIVKAIKQAVAPNYTEKKFKTIECSIMDLADDIAYSTYDLEDSLHANFVSPLSLLYELRTDDAIREKVLKKCNEALHASNYPHIKKAEELIQAVTEIFKGLLEGNVVPSSSGIDVQLWARNRMLNEDGVVRTRFTAERVGELIDAVELVYNKKHPQLSSVRLTQDGLVKVEVLKHLNYELVIRSSRLSVVEHRGRDLVNNIFQAISESGGLLLPDDWRERYDLVKSDKAQAARLVCDYVSGMTDTYAIEVYDRLFGKGASMFKPL